MQTGAISVLQNWINQKVMKCNYLKNNELGNLLMVTSLI